MTNNTLHPLTVQAEIKYRYALDENQNVINIDSERIIRGNDYLCISCGKVLRPVKGEIRQKHFRHKIQVDCSPETYLHNLAKRMFFKTYSDCLQNNQQYFLEYKVPRHCNACKDNGPCEVGNDGLTKIDLTKYFKDISLETRDGDFIPDILLRNGSKSLYIEIAVTHFVGEPKENSGAKIVEIAIKDETDIDLITSCCISETDFRISAKNFIRSPATAAFTKECKNEFYCFILYPDGRSVIDLKPAWKFEELLAKGIYVEKVGQLGPGDNIKTAFVNKVAELYLKGMNIKNCWLCSHHVLDNRMTDNFCMILKKKFRGETNQAVKCANYEPVKTIPECGLMQAVINRLKKSQIDWEIQQQKARQQHAAEKAAAKTVTEKLPVRNIPVIVRPLSGKKAACVYCGKEFDYNTEGWSVFHAASGTCKCKPCLEKYGGNE